VMRLLANPEILREREAAIAHGYRTMPWPVASERMLDVLAGLLRAATQVAAAQDDPPLLVPGATLMPPSGPDEGSPMVIARRELQRLDFAAVLDGEGWHEPESWGGWASGNVARLKFRLPEDQGTTQCYVRVLLPPVCGSQNIDLVLDGQLVGQKVISAQPRSIAVPIGARKGGVCVLELHLRELRTPSEDQVDTRPLGVGLMHIHAVSESDVMARLSYLETHTLG